MSLLIVKAPVLVQAPCSVAGVHQSPLFPLGFVAAAPGPTLMSPSHSCPGELLVMVLTSPSVYSQALCRCLNPARMPTEVPTVSSSGERCASIQAQVHPWAHGAQLPTPDAPGQGLHTEATDAPSSQAPWRFSRCLV